jgi:hypothetical protein
VERKTHDHDINTGEHAANDKPAIDWQRYHQNTPKLHLNIGKTRHETPKNKTKTTD